MPSLISRLINDLALNYLSPNSVPHPQLVLGFTFVPDLHSLQFESVRWPSSPASCARFVLFWEPCTTILVIDSLTYLPSQSYLYKLLLQLRRKCFAWLSLLSPLEF